MSTVLDKAGILSAGKLKSEVVKLKSGDVIVSQITATEYMEVYGSEAVKDDKGEFDGNKLTAVLAARCIVDAKGKRIFADTDADALRGMSAPIYTDIIMAVKRMTGLDATVKN